MVNGKKVKLAPSAQANTGSNLLLFGDLVAPHRCFAIVVPRKLDFQRLFGKDLGGLELISVGLLYGIFEPSQANTRYTGTLIYNSQKAHHCRNA